MFDASICSWVTSVSVPETILVFTVEPVPSTPPSGITSVTGLSTTVSSTTVLSFVSSIGTKKESPPVVVTYCEFQASRSDWIPSFVFLT